MITPQEQAIEILQPLLKHYETAAVAAPDTERVVEGDEFALDAVAFPAVQNRAHDVINGIFRSSPPLMRSSTAIPTASLCWFIFALGEGRYTSRSDVFGSAPENVLGSSRRPNDAHGDVGNFQRHDPHGVSARLGRMRGAIAVTARFTKTLDENALKARLETMLQDKGVACGKIWRAASAGQLPLSEEERLRGGDRRIEACLMVETLRAQDADRIAAVLSTQFPAAMVGVYRLLMRSAVEVLRAPV
jgi:hypothetical protein